MNFARLAMLISLPVIRCRSVPIRARPTASPRWWTTRSAWTGDREVVLTGRGDVIRQAIEAGLVDELLLVAG